MRSRRTVTLQIAVALLLAITSSTSIRAQTIPSDLEIIGLAGGLLPNDEYTNVHITADGQGEYSRFRAGDLSPAVDSGTFELAATELGQIWQAIEAGNFFGLDAQYAATEIVDRTFAELIVTANGSTHRVSTRNIAVEGFDGIVAAMNDVTPPGGDLVYDTSPPFTFVSRNICEQQRKSGYSVVEKQALQGSGLDPEVTELSKTKVRNGVAHPGTTVAYHMTLKEAVAQGIISLSSKGGASGDAMAISVDNSGSASSDRLELSLYLEMWGPGASPSTSQMVEAAIESIWGGKTTSDGKTLEVDVITRTCTSCTMPPGTTGFHQIRMVNDSTITSHVDGSFDLNEGVGSGTWAAAGSGLNELWAHEAGHLFGLEDRYEDYRKQPDGSWERQSDGQSFMTSDLANMIAPFRPDLTLAEIIQKLEDGRQRVTHPQPGSGDDLMASLKNGTVQQKDIDAIAAAAGLLIEVSSGEILMNKAGGQQNFVTIRAEDIFVPPGETKTLGGLYVACIDAHKSIPSAGVAFDLAPPLADWRGIEAALDLQKLVGYVNEQELYCDNTPLWAVWRITDNSGVAAEVAEALLQEAGVDVPDRPFEFPHLTGADVLNPNTSAVTPPELFVPAVEATTADIIDPGTAVAITGAVLAPVAVDVLADVSWSLDSPAGSGATLSNATGESTGFTADVRGIYRLSMEADVTDALGNTVTVDTYAPFVAADDRTETFETGTLRPEAPFFWEANVAVPWNVTDQEYHTGTFSVTSGDIANGETATLSASFEQPVAGPISFAYKVFSENIVDSLLFSVDGVVVERWSYQIDWSTFAVDLGPGTHTVTWSFKRADTFGGGDVRRAWVDDVVFPESAVFTAIEEANGDAVPATYRLFQNYPNPFSSSTTMTYELPQATEVRLELYDVLGRRIRVLASGVKPAGRHKVAFDAAGLPSGNYVYRLAAGDFVETKRMVIVK